MQGLLEKIENGIKQYLTEALKEGRIDEESHDLALENTFENVKCWLTDPKVPQISKQFIPGIEQAVEKNEWEKIVNAYHRPIIFGTGGIRAMMGFDLESIKKMNDEGIDTAILKGCNTINDLVILLTSAGVAKFGKDKGFNKIVVGFDSRIRGQEFAETIAKCFLANDYTVYLFDEACPYPEVTFAIPYEEIKADLGILISASHNDYRYNGFKISCANGSQFDLETRNEMYNNYIQKATPEDIPEIKPSFSDYPQDVLEKLIILGGDTPLPNYDYAGRENSIIDIHKAHCKHIESFLLNDDLEKQEQEASDPLHIGYCAFHGAGRKAVPRLLTDIGFRKENIQVITADGMNDLNGFFPSFDCSPGKEQQPDPGDKRAADTAVKKFKKQYPGDFEKLDILIGTDPDADRCGVVVKVPENQRHLYDGDDYYLLPADELWALILWYRIQKEKPEKKVDSRKKFIVLSHVTSDCLVKFAQKHDIGIVKTWVGFAKLASAVNDVWVKDPAGDKRLIEKYLNLSEGRTPHVHSSGNPALDLCNDHICECIGINAEDERSINIAAMEQSNGFSILGGEPPDAYSLGMDGHVRDKDGTFAAMLVAELASYAKQNGTSLYELIDNEIYLDPDVGLFINFYEPDPQDGEYPGIEGDRTKKAILRRTLGLYQFALTGDLEIGGKPVLSACIYRTGVYDPVYPPTHDFMFPDEGVRFYFDKERLDHLTVRPSGTGNSLRFHVQLHCPVTKENLIEKKASLRGEANKILDDIRDKLGAPRK